MQPFLGGGNGRPFREIARMLSPDVVLAALANRTAAAYEQHAPAFMVYQERTHFSIPGHREQSMDREIKVRVSDDASVMQDLPQGVVRTGQAFPIIPYFDPFSVFGFGYFANLRRVDITLDRGKPYVFPMPPADPGVNVVVPYISFWIPSFASDSTDQRAHLTIASTPRWQPSNAYYPYDVLEDASSHLPARIMLKNDADDSRITLDYAVIDGHRIVRHGTFSVTQHVGPLTFRALADTTFDQFAFPATAPDAALR